MTDQKWQEITVDSKDRYPRGDCRVHYLRGADTILAIATVYSDGRKALEFDSDFRYAFDLAEDIVFVARDLTY